MQQPAASVCARVRSRPARLVVEAAFAEDVEIARVEMFGIEKALACVAFSGPLVVEPCKAATIELSRREVAARVRRRRSCAIHRATNASAGMSAQARRLGICTRKPEGGHNGDRGDASLLKPKSLSCRRRRAVSASSAAGAGYRRFVASDRGVGIGGRSVQAGCGASALWAGAVMDAAACRRRTTRSWPSASMTAKREGATP